MSIEQEKFQIVTVQSGDLSVWKFTASTARARARNQVVAARKKACRKNPATSFSCYRAGACNVPET